MYRQGGFDSATVETLPQGRAFQLVPFDDIRVTTRPDYLIKGLLPETGLAVVWGPPQSGKSFWAFDAAMHVALGWGYRDKRVRPAPVVYVAGEGQGGFKKRVEAFRLEFMQADPPPPFYLLGEPVDMIGQHGQLISDIRDQLGDTPPGLVVLDTLNRTLRGDENSPEDMGRYVAAADSVRDAFGCCVLIVHHCGVDGSRPRGHTALTAAADAQFAVSASGDTRTVEVDKAKDGPTGERLTFKLRTVDVCTDDDGDPVTSCVVEPTEAPAPEASGPRLTANQQTMLSILLDAGSAGLTTEEWNKRAREAGLGLRRPPDLYDFRKGLQGKGCVREAGGRWCVVHE